jgi:hypothetical protein
MATNDQVNQISDGAILSSRESAQVNERAVGETDLHAIGALGVVGHQISSPEAIAGAKACAGIAPEGEAGTQERMPEEFLTTSANLVEDDGDHSCKPVGRFALRALAAIYNRMQPPLSDPPLLDSGFAHVNGPSGAGLLLRNCQTDSDCPETWEGPR